MSNAKTIASDVSQRSKKAQKSKTVFKPVLDNPFTIQWPEIPLNVQNNILAALVDLLSCLKEYHSERQRGSRKAKRILRQQSKPSTDENSRKRKDSPGSERADPAKKMRTEAMDVTSTDTKEDSMNHAGDPSDSNDVHDRDQMHVDNAKTDASSISSPPILKHLVIGLNEVTKYLERHITRLRESMVGEKALSEDTSLPCALFACRWDLNPPTLISHIPHLVASFNTLANLYNAKFQTATAIPDLKLINLPKGAESSLSDCIGIRRVSMVLINSKESLGPRLNDMIAKVSKLSTPWLLPIAGQATMSISHIPTHIKHIKTTAPVDLKAAKRERTHDKQEAKQRKENARKPTIAKVSATKETSTTNP